MSAHQIRRVWKDADGTDVHGPWTRCPTCPADSDTKPGAAVWARLAASAWQRMRFADARQLPTSLQTALDGLCDALQGGVR